MPVQRHPMSIAIVLHYAMTREKLLQTALLTPEKVKVLFLIFKASVYVLESA